MVINTIYSQTFSPLIIFHHTHTPNLHFILVDSLLFSISFLLFPFFLSFFLSFFFHPLALPNHQSLFSFLGFPPPTSLSKLIPCPRPTLYLYPYFLFFFFLERKRDFLPWLSSTLGHGSTFLSQAVTYGEKKEKKGIFQLFVLDWRVMKAKSIILLLN